MFFSLQEDIDCKYILHQKMNSLPFTTLGFHQFSPPLEYINSPFHSLKVVVGITNCHSSCHYKLIIIFLEGVSFIRQIHLLGFQLLEELHSYFLPLSPERKWQFNYRFSQVETFQSSSSILDSNGRNVIISNQNHSGCFLSFWKSTPLFFNDRKCRLIYSHRFPVIEISLRKHIQMVFH